MPDLSIYELNNWKHYLSDVEEGVVVHYFDKQGLVFAGNGVAALVYYEPMRLTAEMLNNNKHIKYMMNDEYPIDFYFKN